MTIHVEKYAKGLLGTFADWKNC